MLIYFIKFIHLLATLGLLGIAVYCFFLTLVKNKYKIPRLNKVLLLLTAITLFTGTLLVHPRHFTFHTPWIDAAYILITLVLLILLFIILFSKKFADTRRLSSLLLYSFLITLFCVIIHDAVTKTTFLF